MHFHKRLNALILSLFAASLAACSTTKMPTSQVVLSNEQFKCRDMPAVPNPETMTDNQLAVFIARLEDAGEDCRAQLRELKAALSVQSGVLITDVLVEEKKPAKRWPWG